MLSGHDISWVNYHNVRPAMVLLKRAFGAPGLVALRRLAKLGRWLPGVLNAVRGNKSFTADLYPLGFARSLRHLRTTQQFFADAAAGTLPAVSIVDPDFGGYSEENPQDIGLGESFAAAVVNAVMAGPGWASTLLIWTYDEHGGYYDHVPPPAAVPPDFVLSDVLDHTSVLKLIEEKWNLPSLTSRDAAAIAPLGALDLDAEPAFLTPPTLPAAKSGPFQPSLQLAALGADGADGLHLQGAARL